MTVTNTDTTANPQSTELPNVTLDVGTVNVHGNLWRVDVHHHPDGASPFIPETWATLISRERELYVAMFITEHPVLDVDQLLDDTRAWIISEYYSRR